MRAQQAKEQGEPFRRLGIRMDPGLYELLEEAVVPLNRAARKRGERVTKKSIVEEAVEHYLVFLEKGGLL